MTDETNPTLEIAPGKRRGARDLGTIIAISIVAFAIASLLHEGVGYGGVCELTGGHAQLLSTVHFECDQDSRFIAAGGTLVTSSPGSCVGLRCAP